MKNPILLCLWILLAWNSQLFASDAGVKEYAVVGGWVLPDQVPGMTEVLPTWGLRGGLGVSQRTLLSASYFNALAKGVDSHQLNLEARYSAFSEGVIGYLSAGAALLRYESDTLEEEQQKVNILMSTGALLHLNHRLWLQSEMQFQLDPGVQLRLTFGLAYRL